MQYFVYVRYYTFGVGGGVCRLLTSSLMYHGHVFDLILYVFMLDIVRWGRYNEYQLQLRGISHLL
jgi:hypothetical protein